VENTDVISYGAAVKKLPVKHNPAGGITMPAGLANKNRIRCVTLKVTQGRPKWRNAITSYQWSVVQNVAILHRSRYITIGT